jgi:Protein of unknown function (DUF1549)
MLPCLALRPRRLTATAVAVGLFAAAVCAQDTPEPKPDAKDSPKPVAVPTMRGAAAQTQKINELLGKAWAENKIRPSQRCRDTEFVRRAYLDLVGRIATPAEVRYF